MFSPILILRLILSLLQFLQTFNKSKIFYTYYLVLFSCNKRIYFTIETKMIGYLRTDLTKHMQMLSGGLKCVEKYVMFLDRKIQY